MVLLTESTVRLMKLLALLFIVTQLSATAGASDECSANDGVEQQAGCEGGGAGEEAAEDRTTIKLVNFSEDQITIFWKDDRAKKGNEGIDNGIEHGDHLHEIDSVDPYESKIIHTFIGHSFYYQNDKSFGSFTVKDYDSNQPIGMRRKGGISAAEGSEDGIEEEILVTCSTTEGEIRMHITPESSPIGALFFLKLVNYKNFDGCALNRVVDGYLAQFGISADYESRTRTRGRTIGDDFSSETTRVHFKPGSLSYAASGPNSRGTEIFVVMANTPQSQLDYFGTKSWETPFGYIEPDDVENVVSRWYSGYGDMPPYGSGPDPERMYEVDGYYYLKTEFPLLSYIHSCQIVYNGEQEEEELCENSSQSCNAES